MKKLTMDDWDEIARCNGYSDPCMLFYDYGIMTSVRFCRKHHRCAIIIPICKWMLIKKRAKS